MYKLLYYTLLVTLLCAKGLYCYSQTGNNCDGITISGNTGATYSFSDYESQMAGTTITEALAVQYNPNANTCNGWSLRVRATDNFTNGANFVAPQYISLRFNRVSQGSPTASEIGVSNNDYPLNVSDVTLIGNSNAAFSDYTEHTFDMVIQGGNHLLVPNGTYTSSLIFTLYNQNNQAVSTVTIPVAFQVQTTANNSFTMLLQNGAEMVNMVFNTVNDYRSEKSVNIANGLKVLASAPYQVIVKTSNDALTSNTSSATIPVNAISIEATQSTATSAGISVYNRHLSVNEQVLINTTNPLDSTQQMVEYNLRYAISASTTDLMQPSGRYSVNIIFIVLPQ